MDTLTLAIILTFVLLVLALIFLPAALFIRLVGLIRDIGSKVEVASQEAQQARTILSDVMVSATSSKETTDMPITPAEANTPSTESILTPKSRKSS